MNRGDKLKANLLIAKALGHETEVISHWPSPVETSPVDAAFIPDEAVDGDGGAMREFNIFTNDTDLKNAVIHLGEKHDIVPVAPLGCGTNNWTTIWRTSGSNKKATAYNTSMLWFDTYQEAVASAYIALDG